MATETPDERELAVGRHLGRWGGHTHITSVASARPWALGADALVVPIGENPSAADGPWMAPLERVVDGASLRAAIAAAFERVDDDFPRVRTIELPLLRPSRHSSPLLRVLLVRIGTAAEQDELEQVTSQVVLRADALRVRTLALTIFADGTDAPARKRVSTMLARIESLPPPVELRTVLLVAPSIAAFADVGARPLRPQAFTNDAVHGNDLLDNAVEAGALAEMLMLRELEPPLVVGVLGGWGSGKSFALELIAQRMRQIRALPVDRQMAWPEDAEQAFTYVGHIYTVRFDAWTFAKADLWSSLMGTIFDELERQLTLEQRLASAICPPARPGDTDATVAEQRREKIRLGGPLWGVLAELDPLEQQRYLRHLTEGEQAELERLAAEGPGELWAELRRRTAEQRSQLEQRERELEQLRADSLRRRTELERALNEEEAWRAYAALLRAKTGGLFERIREILAQKVRPDGSIDAEFSLAERLRAIPQLILQRPLEFAIVVGVVVAVGVLAMIALEDRWRALVASITAIVSAIGIYIHAGRALLGQLFERYGEFQSMVDQVAAVQTEARIVRRKEVFDRDGALQEIESRVVEVETTVVRSRADLVLGEFGSVQEFVRARVEGGGYSGRLGPMHGVQADLRELSRALSCHELDAVRLRELFPRGPARVALFIDDLDRCPPDRVVEVLEATQLLLKTRLFVVVAALDVRYVSRALERVYGGVLSRMGAPSGLDYIEKIIQIPYRVPLLDGPAFAEYLRAQVQIAPVEDDAVPRLVDPLRDESQPPGRQGRIRRDAALRHPTDPEQRLQWQSLPTKLLQLTIEEADRLQHCAGELSLTPRAAKRLINVYKLLKIIWAREPNRRPRDGEETAILGLLALACAWPHPMREVFSFLEARVFQRPGTQLREVVGVLARACERTPWLEQAWARADAAARRVLPSVRIEELSPDAVATAQMFSFVGDIGYDPGDGSSAGYFDPDELPTPGSPEPTRPAGLGARRAPPIEW